MEKWHVFNTSRGMLASTDPEFFRTIDPFEINWTKRVQAESEDRAIIYAKSEHNKDQNMRDKLLRGDRL